MGLKDSAANLYNEFLDKLEIMSTKKIAYLCILLGTLCIFFGFSMMFHLGGMDDIPMGSLEHSSPLLLTLGLLYLAYAIKIYVYPIHIKPFISKMMRNDNVVPISIMPVPVDKVKPPFSPSQSLVKKILNNNK